MESHRVPTECTQAGVARFEVAKAEDFPGKDYDFVAVFDCSATWETQSAPPHTSALP